MARKFRFWLYMCIGITQWCILAATASIEDRVESRDITRMFVCYDTLSLHCVSLVRTHLNSIPEEYISMSVSELSIKLIILPNEVLFCYTHAHNMNTCLYSATELWRDDSLCGHYMSDTNSVVFQLRFRNIVAHCFSFRKTFTVHRNTFWVSFLCYFSFSSGKKVGKSFRYSFEKIVVKPNVDECYFQIAKK